MNKTKKTTIFLILGIVFTLFSSVIIFAQNGEKNYLITETSVGDVKLGMTVGEALKVLPKGVKLGDAAGYEGSTLIGVYEGDKLLFTIGSYDSEGDEELAPINEDQKIEVMLIFDSRFKTAEGVHIGMPIKEAEKKYGKLLEIINDPHSGQWGKFTNQPGSMEFSFETKSNVEVTVAVYERIPNCEITDSSDCLELSYAPDSYISGMSITSPSPIQQTISITDTPKDYEVNIYGPSECVEEEGLGETTYSISWKVPLENGGSSLPSQQFNFEGLLPCPELGYGENKTTVSYKDQFDVFLDDFNFDGMTDLALRDGMNGGYGFPSYQVYLFSKEKNEFVLSPSFTELGQYQGMFEVNEKRKMIYNHTKSGCCSHTTEGYKIVNNKPFKVYDHTVEGFIEMANGVTTPEVTTKKLINGKWRTWASSSAERISFDRGKSSKTITVKLNKNEPIKWLKVGAAKGQILSVNKDSADADVRVVDFKGDVSLYESSIDMEKNETLFAKLLGTGDYFVEVSAEKNVNVSLTIKIEKDDGSIQFPNFDTDETDLNKDAVKDEDKTTIPKSKDDKLPDNLITSTSVGKIKLGMTVAEARKVLKGYEFSRTHIGYRDLAISVQKGGKEVLKLDAGEGEDPDTGDGNPIKENLKIVGIEVFDSRYKTAEGVHSGITIAEAEKRYGKIKKIDRTDETPEIATFTDNPKGFYFSIEGKKGPDDKDSGYYLAGIYGENNYETNRYKPDAFISSILIFTQIEENKMDADSADVDHLITSTSIGPIKLGMTIGEARKVLKGFKLGPAPGDEGTWLVGVYEGKDLLFTIGDYGDYRGSEDEMPPINEDQKIAVMLILDSRFRTAEGVQIGTTIAEAEKKYGKLKEMFNFPHEGEFGRFTGQPENFGFTFRPAGEDYTAGIYEEIPNCKNDYPPACYVATKYNSGSFIHTMSIQLPLEKIARWEIEFEDLPEDIKVAIDGPTECRKNSEGEFAGVATYHIWKTTGTLTDYQEIPVDRTTLPCVEENQSRTESYKDQYFIFYDDFNFDGIKDLALYDGNNGGYGFGSYQVYLYSSSDKKFVHNAPFTELAQYQGMFEVDKTDKMIRVSGKSGCCFYQTEGYNVVKNSPVKIYEKTTDYLAPGATEDDPKVITKKLIGGKWTVVPNEPEK